MPKLAAYSKDFSSGRTGEVGQYGATKTHFIKDSLNFVSTRKGKARQCGGVKEIAGIPLQKNDIILPFRLRGQEFFFVYDPLFYRRLTTPEKQTSGDFFNYGKFNVPLGDDTEMRRYHKTNMDNLNWLQEDKKKLIESNKFSKEFNLWTLKRKNESLQTEIGKRFQDVMDATFRSSNSPESRWNTFLDEITPLREEFHSTTAWFGRHLIFDSEGNLRNVKCLRHLVSECSSIDNPRASFSKKELDSLSDTDITLDDFITRPIELRNELFGKGTGEYEVIVRPNDVLFHDRHGILPTLRWGPYLPHDIDDLDNENPNPNVYSTYTLVEYRCLYATEDVQTVDIPCLWFNSSLTQDEFGKIKSFLSTQVIPGFTEERVLWRKGRDFSTQILPSSLYDVDLWSARKIDVRSSPFVRPENNAPDYRDDNFSLEGLVYSYTQDKRVANRDQTTAQRESIYSLLATYDGYPIWIILQNTHLVTGSSGTVANSNPHGHIYSLADIQEAFRHANILVSTFEIFLGPRSEVRKLGSITFNSVGTTVWDRVTLAGLPIRKEPNLAIQTYGPSNSRAYVRILEFMGMGIFHYKLNGFRTGSLSGGSRSAAANIGLSTLNSLRDRSYDDRLTLNGSFGGSQAGFVWYFHPDDRSRVVNYIKGIFPGTNALPHVTLHGKNPPNGLRVYPNNLGNPGATTALSILTSAFTTPTIGMARDNYPFIFFGLEQTVFGGVSPFTQQIVVSSNDVNLNKLLNTQRDYNIFELLTRGGVKRNPTTGRIDEEAESPLVNRSYLHTFSLEGGGSILWASLNFINGKSTVVFGHTQGFIETPSLSLLDVINAKILDDVAFSEFPPVFLYGDQYILDTERSDILYARYDFSYNSRRNISICGDFEDELRGNRRIKKMIGFRKKGYLAFLSDGAVFVCLINQKTDSRGWFKLRAEANIDDIHNINERFIFYIQQKVFEWDIYGETNYNIENVIPWIELIDADAYTTESEGDQLNGVSQNIHARGEFKGKVNAKVLQMTGKRGAISTLSLSGNTFQFDYVPEGEKSVARIGFKQIDKNTPIDVTLSQYRLVVGG